jgi:curved DNA-binding protein CbpA
MPAAPKFDPYAVLGVPRDAGADDVKRAHRMRAKETHPDAGGKDDDSKSAEFADVQRAWLVLSDPEKRAHYDKTGDAGGDQPVQDPDAPSLGIIARLFNAILADASDEAFQTNLAVVISQALQTNIDEVTAQLQSKRRMLQRAMKFKGRFRKRDGSENKIDPMIEWHIRQLEGSIKTGELAIAQCRRAQEIIADYDFTQDQPPPSQYGGFSFNPLAQTQRQGPFGGPLF